MHHSLDDNVRQQNQDGVFVKEDLLFEQKECSFTEITITIKCQNHFTTRGKYITFINLYIVVHAVKNEAVGLRVSNTSAHPSA